LQVRREPSSPAIAELDPGDAAVPILLEFESPTASLLAQRVPVRARYTTYVIFSMVMMMVIAASTLPIARVVPATGRVVAVDQPLVVQPFEISIVRSIDVNVGQVVHKGDVLAQLDPTNAGSDTAALETAVASLSAETKRLQAELDGRIYLSDGTPHGELQALLFTQRHAEITAQMANYEQKINALRAPVMQAQTDIRGFTERLSLAHVVEDKRRELERLGVGSQLNTFAASDTRAETQRQLDVARANLAQGQRNLDAMIAERDGALQQWNATTSQSMADQGRKLDQAMQDLQKARLRLNMVALRAPVDAVVFNIANVSKGAVMSPGEQLIQLVPLNSPLEIEAIIDGNDSGYVTLGDPTTIKFATFPYITHGMATGKLRVLSPDSAQQPFNPLSGQPTMTPIQQQLGNLFYRARVSLDDIKLHDLPDGFQLIPGMPVEVDIQVGHRTFMGYLLFRVLPAAKEAFHEP